MIQKGAAIEAICKDTKYLTEAEFYQLMDELLHDPACKFVMSFMKWFVDGRKLQKQKTRISRRGSIIKGDATR